MKMRKRLGMKAAKLIYPATQRSTNEQPAPNRWLGSRWYLLILAGIRWYSLVVFAGIR